MSFTSIHLLLADDDKDDRLFFKEAVEELPVESVLATVSNGIELMKLLASNPSKLPDILFLDLNMPLKSGYECLSEIKQNEDLTQLPVIIYSTAFNKELADLLYEKGAHYYIKNPPAFQSLSRLSR